MAIIRLKEKNLGVASLKIQTKIINKIIQF